MPTRCQLWMEWMGMYKLFGLQHPVSPFVQIGYPKHWHSHAVQELTLELSLEPPVSRNAPSMMLCTK
jgi:hypothetical protein